MVILLVVLACMDLKFIMTVSIGSNNHPVTPVELKRRELLLYEKNDLPQ